MSKTADLRKLINAQMNTIMGETYHRRAKPDANYPYKTFTLSRVDLNDPARDDFELMVDIWDHATDSKAVDEIADQLEELFNCNNLPQGTILPTFYKSSRYPVDDPDKDIQHVQMTFLVEMYTNS